MASWTERAFDLITEISKQIITPSTGLIALGITFNKDFLPTGSLKARPWLEWSWGAFILAIVFAVYTLMASAGVQAAAGKSATAAPPDPYSGAIRPVAILEVIAFAAGLVLTVIAGIASL